MATTLFVIASDFIAINIVIRILVSDIIKVNGCSSFLIIQPRTGVAKVVVLIILAAKLPTNINLIAGAAEVFITNGNHTNKAVGIAIASANTKGAGVHFYNIDFYLNGVRLATGVQLHVDIFKITQVIHALHAAACILSVKGLAGLELHFPGNNVILTFLVTLNLEALYQALVYSHLQGAILLHVYIGNTGQNVAGRTIFFFQLLHAFIDLLKISNFTLF